MASPLRVDDIDKGWQELTRQVELLSKNGGTYALVGVMGSEGAANHNKARGLTVAQIAQIHEFGKTITTKAGHTIVIPQRSFIRAGIDEHQNAIQRRATLLGQGVMLLKFTALQALGLLGEYTVGVLKQRIANGIAPPNAPRTIARKRSSKPLIDSGQLRNSITYKIEGQ